jgi:hypothetical protein
MEAKDKNEISDSDRAAFHRLVEADERQCNNAFRLVRRLQREAADLGPALRDRESQQAALAVAMHGALADIETGLRTLYERKRHAELRHLGVDAVKLDAYLAGDVPSERPDIFLETTESAPTADSSQDQRTHVAGGAFDVALVQLRRSACAEGLAYLVVYGAAAPGHVDAVVNACMHCTPETQALFGKAFPAVQRIFKQQAGVVGEAEAPSIEAEAPRVWKCNGGPNAAAWCGAEATHVGRDETGLEWFCCSKHTEGVGGEQRPATRLLPIADWQRINEIH